MLRLAHCPVSPVCGVSERLYGIQLCMIWKEARFIFVVQFKCLCKAGTLFKLSNKITVGGKSSELSPLACLSCRQRWAQIVPPRTARSNTLTCMCPRIADFPAFSASPGNLLLLSLGWQQLAKVLPAIQGVYVVRRARLSYKILYQNDCLADKLENVLATSTHYIYLNRA